MKQNSTNTKLLLFDYDGVLAHSHEQMLDTIRKTCKIMKVTAPDVEVLRSREAKTLLKEMGLNWWQILRFVSLSRNDLASKEFPPLESGMREFLEETYLKQFTLGIVSSARKDHIEAFLENEKISKYFSFVQGSISMWGKDKVLGEVYKKFQPLKALYVGDEERDIIAGRTAGFEVIAVGWGAKHGNFLKTYRPEYYVESPKILLDLIKSL